MTRTFAAKATITTGIVSSNNVTSPTPLEIRVPTKNGPQIEPILPKLTAAPVPTPRMARMESLFGAASTAILALYQQAYPKASPSRLWIQANSDFSILLPTIYQAERRLAANSAGTWLYRLKFQSPALGGKVGALHTMEGSLLFNQPASGRALPGDGPDVHQLAQRMSGAWASFAATGDPNNAQSDLPDWPQYDLTLRRAMAFDRECQLTEDILPQLRDALAPHLQLVLSSVDG